MIYLMTILAAWPIPSMALLITCRAVLLIQLARYGVDIKYALAGIPGYLERRYRAAPETIQLRLANLFRWNRILLVNLLISSVLGFGVAVLFLLGRRG